MTDRDRSGASATKANEIAYVTQFRQIAASAVTPAACAKLFFHLQLLTTTCCFRKNMWATWPAKPSKDWLLPNLSKPSPFQQLRRRYMGQCWRSSRLKTASKMKCG